MDFKLETTDAVPLDPRDGWELTANQIATMRTRELPAEVAEQIVQSQWRTLDAALAEIFRRGNYGEAGAALNAFDTALMAAVGKEYERVRAAAGDGIDDLVSVLNDRAWNGIEIDTIRRMLEPGERLARVDLRFVETSKGRRIGRPEVQEAAKPSTQTNGRWGENFIGEATLRELEVEAERKKNPLPPWHDSRNRDLPRGVRA